LNELNEGHFVCWAGCVALMREANAHRTWWESSQKIKMEIILKLIVLREDVKY
jgi:hypothetical protein